MAKKLSEGSSKKKTVVKEFIKLEDLPQVIKEKFDAYRISPQMLDYCMRVAVGESPLSVIKDLYNYETPEAKRQLNKMVCNPKIQTMIKSIQDNLKMETYLNSLVILNRMEILYQNAVEEEDNFMALNVLKEMGKIIKDNSGTTTVTDLTIQFSLPNSINVKQKQIEDITDSEIVE